MRINRIRLKHFRSHSHTVISLERVNFIRGLNRSGKSSLAMAIEIALSGRCAVTDEGGKGYEALIQQGQQTATIILECSNVMITVTLDRKDGRTFKVEVDGRTILGRHAQEWIAEKIAPPDVMSASLNAWRFLRLSNAEQADLLARVLLPSTLELEPEVSAWLTANKLSVVERPTLFATIEATHKSIAAARTDVSRKLRDLKAIEEPDPIVGSRDAIKAKLATLQENQAALRGMYELRVKAEEDARKNAERMPSLQTEIEAARTRFTTLPSLLSPAERSPLEAIVKKKEDRAMVVAVLSERRAALTKTMATIERLKKMNGQTALCPTCNQPLTEAARNALLHPFLQDESELRTAIAALELELNAIGDITEAEHKLAIDDDYRSKHAQAHNALSALEEDLTRLQHPTSPDVMQFGESVETMRAELETLKARIVKGLDALVRIVELEERHATYERQMKERANAEERLEQLQRLLVYFGPGGLKAKLIAERVEVFLVRVNAVLEWWGYRLSLTMDPYALTITEYDAPGVSLAPHQLSTSESYRLGVALAVAIAEWTQVRLLVADAADILDKPDKWQLAQALLRSDALDQSIITSTGIAGTFDAHGTAFYTLSRADGVTATELDALTESTAVA